MSFVFKKIFERYTIQVLSSFQVLYKWLDVVGSLFVLFASPPFSSLAESEVLGISEDRPPVFSKTFPCLHLRCWWGVGAEHGLLQHPTVGSRWVSFTSGTSNTLLVTNSFLFLVARSP